MRYRRPMHPIDRQRGYQLAPRGQVFKDRSTGTLYLLSHDSSDDTLALTTPVPALAHVVSFEPIINTPAGPRRMYVEAGVLAYEIPNQGETGTFGPAPVFTLNFAERRTTYELHGEGATELGDPLCLRKYTNVGRTVVVEDLGCTIALGQDLYVLDGYVDAGYVT